MVRDCSTSQVDFDNQITIGIYYPGQTQGMLQKVGDTIIVLKSQNAMLIDFYDSNCCNCPNMRTQCYKEGLYEGYIEVNHSIDSVVLFYERCCRTTSSNLELDLPITLFSVIKPKQTSSSIILSGKQLIAPLLNRPSKILPTFKTANPDNDSLVYKLESTFNLGVASNTDPLPIYPSILDFSFNKTIYHSGFSSDSIFGIPNSFIHFSQDSVCLRVNISTIGKYSTGLYVYEFRNGQHVGTTYADVLVIVYPCFNYQTGVETNEKKQPFEIYQNVISIKAISSEPFQVYDMRGVLVYKEQIIDANHTIDLQNLSNGIYILKYGSYSQKMLKTE
ncbi:MAG: T9SS type A sorting domain-containing protein [Bacteroidetes bacterium]|nr:T9SS type A sorting domain-containing protein [Bacteroidota bacterium]